MFGAPAHDAFGAPPPPSSSAKFPPPPAAIFDAPPQDTFHAPRVAPTAEELGSPPASVFDAPPQGGYSAATCPFGPSGGTGGSREGGDTFGAKKEDFGGGAGGPVGAAAPFGSPPGSVFGGGGDGGEDQSSAWWESETGNDDQPDPRVEPESLASGTAAGENKGGAASVVHALEGVQGVRTGSSRAPSGTQEETPTAHEPHQRTSHSACAEAREEDLGAPPADMFAAHPQTATPPGQPPRPQAPPSRVAHGSVTPDPFSSRPPYGAKVDVGDVEGVVSSAAGTGANRPGSGVGVEAWADRTTSPGWEKQPSPPLDLGVFGAPPEGSVTAVRGAADLFGATPEGADDESTEGGGEHGGWGMCSAEPGGAPESDTGNGTAGADSPIASARIPAASSTESGLLQKLAHLSIPPRSSFAANDGAATASGAALGHGIGNAPSSSPRLFASRSSSWTEKEPSSTGGDNNDYEGMFAGKESKVKGGGLPPRERSALQQQGREDTNITTNLAAAGPTSSLAMDEVLALLPKTEPSPSLNLPPLGSNTSSEKYPRGAQRPFPSIPGALGARSPPRLPDRSQELPEEGLAAVEITSSGSRASNGSTGPTAATPESGGRVGPGSTLSTPFETLSRGSEITPRIAEGFPSSEDGSVFDGPPVDGSVSGGKGAPPGCTEAPGRSRVSDGASAPVVVPSVSAEDDGGGDGGHVAAAVVASGDAAAIGEANDGDGAVAVLTNQRAVEGKEDGQPRWAGPQAAAYSPPPLSAAEEAARKTDADKAPDSGDGWSDDDWGVDDDDDDDAEGDAHAIGQVRGKSGDEGGKDETAGAAVASGGSLPGAIGSEGEGETNLFGSEASHGGESWGRGQEEEEDGSGRAEEGGEESCSGSESSDLGSFSDSSLSNEASIAETTASDFFAVRQWKIFRLSRTLLVHAQKTELSCDVHLERGHPPAISIAHLFFMPLSRRLYTSACRQDSHFFTPGCTSWRPPVPSVFVHVSDLHIAGIGPWKPEAKAPKRGPRFHEQHQPSLRIQQLGIQQLGKPSQAPRDERRQR